MIFTKIFKKKQKLVDHKVIVVIRIQKDYLVTKEVLRIEKTALFIIIMIK